MIININGKEIELRFKFRSEILFEEVQSRSFEGKSISDWILYYYCTVIANTDDGFIEYEKFIEWLDENPDSIYAFIQWYTEFQTGIMAKRSEQLTQEAKKKAQRKKAPGK